MTTLLQRNTKLRKSFLITHEMFRLLQIYKLLSECFYVTKGSIRAIVSVYILNLPVSNADFSVLTSMLNSNRV